MADTTHIYLIFLFLDFSLFILFFIKKNVKRDYKYVLLIIGSFLHLIVLFVLSNYHVYPSILSDTVAKVFFALNIYLIVFLTILMIMYLVDAFYSSNAFEVKLTKYSAYVFVISEVFLSLSPKTFQFIRRNNGHIELQGGPLIYLYYGVLVLFLFVGVYYLIKQKNRVGVSNLYQYIIIIFLIGVSLIFLPITREFLYDALVVIFLCVAYFNIESPANYVVSSYNVLNKKALKRVMPVEPLKKPKMYIIIQLKNVEYLSGNIIDSHQVRIIEDTISIIQKLYTFQNVFYIGHGLIVASPKNEKTDFNYKVFFENSLDKNVFFELPYSVYPVIFELIYNKQEIINYDKFFQIIDIFINESRNLKPFEILNHNNSYFNKVSRSDLVLKAIKTGIEKSKFKITYQPVFYHKTNKYYSCETIVHLEDDSLGDIEPEEYIPIAESYDLNKTIDYLTVDKITDFMNKYRQTRKIGSISLNFPVNEICDQQFLSEIIYLIDKKNLPHDLFTFEIRRSGNAFSEESLVRNINLLHNQNFKVSLDQYESGYSSLHFISTFPVDIIKIGIQRENETSKVDLKESLFKNLLVLCSNINKTVIIENVNTLEDKNSLSNYNVEFIEGLFLCKPLLEEEFLDFLDKEANINEL